MASITVKRHDTWPPIKSTLQETNEAGNKVPINLSGVAQVRFYMKLQGGSRLVEGVCNVTSAINGQVEYVWGTEDTSVSGTYDVEFEIEHTATHIQTVPSAEYDTIIVKDDLPNA